MHKLLSLKPVAWILLIGSLFAGSPGVLSAAPLEYTFTTIIGVAEGGIGARDGVGTQARFNYPGGMAVLPDGTIYLGDILNHTVRKISPSGLVTTLAGMAGEAGSADGTGGTARLSEPRDVVLDAAGNIYVADSGNHVIRKITPAGVVTTFAGTAGVAGTANATGKAARFKHPGSITIDPAGNLYVADTENHTIRKITPAAVVTTLAGSPGSHGSTDGKGTAARFNAPQGIAADAAGNLYVADTSNLTIRKVTPDGTVTTLAGKAGETGSANGPGASARFAYPFGIETASDGTVYLTDPSNGVIRKITPAGDVSTAAGVVNKIGTQDGESTAATFYNPLGIALGRDGLLLIADSYNHTVRTLTTGGQVSTLAGAPISSGSTDAAGGAARFLYTYGPGIGQDGTLYMSDVGNHTIRKISPQGDVTTIAGTAGTSGTNDGAGLSAKFQSPVGIVADSQNNVFVADSGNHTIRKITPGGEVTTFAGAPGTAGNADGTGTEARFRNPQALTLGQDGSLYVADSFNHIIRKITPAGQVSTLAGSAGSVGSANGTGAAARFNYPLSIAADSTDNIYVADTYNHTIRKISPAGEVTTFAGVAGSPGATNGSVSVARFYYPFGVAVDAAGVVYVADEQNQLIRRIAAGQVTTIAGSRGVVGSLDGTGNDARFNYPYSLSVDAAGNLFVADTYNHTLRKGHPALPDQPTVDIPGAGFGVQRRLDVLNASTTAWSWEFVRYPANASAQLSSSTARNPTFTPDVADVFVLRFRGTDSQGRAALGNVTASLVVESVAPTLTITSPKTGQRWSNSVVTLSGTAGDNTGIATVWCRANSDPWVKADGTTAWSAALTLNAGANTLQAYAVDLAGNNSGTASITVTYVLADKLGVAVTGQGTLTPNYSGALLEVGKSYKVTAKSAAGQIFSHWEDETGAVVSRSAIWTFTMRNGLALKAVFIPNPFIPTKGSYAGLAYNPAAINHTSSGLFTANLTDKGKFSAKVLWAGVSYSLSGTFNADGSFSNAIVRKGLSPLSVELQLGLNGEDNIIGTFTDGTVTSALEAHRAFYSSSSQAPEGGRKYTFAIPGAEDSATRPGGHGYGTISILATGNATISGVLGDGTKFTQKTFLSKHGTLPFYAALYSTRGSAFGWLSLRGNDAATDVAGVVRWSCPANAAAPRYPAGFAFPEGLPVVGSLFSSTSPMVNWTNGRVTLEKGGLAGAIHNPFTVVANKVTGANKLVLTFTPSTGLFKGTAVDPATARPIAFTGVVLQKQGLGFGHFLGTGQTGSVSVLQDQQ